MSPMILRLCVLLSVAISYLAPLSIGAANDAPIAYTLSFPEAAAHYVDVDMQVPSEGVSELVLFMSVWTPGSYLVREYSRNIVRFEAFDMQSRKLDAIKISKNRWKVETGGSEQVRVKYRLFAREINVRGNWVESDFAVINGAPTFLSVVGEYQRPYQVSIELPVGWQTTASSLPPGSEPNTYEVPDFDTLIDSPIIAGSPQIDTFEVDGVTHSLVTLGGGGVWDNARAARNVKRLVETQRDFWGSLPYDEPYYVFNLLTGSRGGLEHKQSLTMTADRWYASSRGGIRSWLSLVSHEFFHAWNGKRLRPIELGPFAYEEENYTRSLWIVEGITSYYQHVLLARAGYNTVDQYLGALSGSIAGTQRTPGRHTQALSCASYDAWIKSYRPDENSVNALFSYYGGGTVAGFLIDAKIQRVSEGKASLDDVMLAAYERFSGESGYTEDAFIDLASEIAGEDLSDWFEALVRTPGEWDYQPALDWFGLEFEAPKPYPSNDAFPLEDEPVDRARGWLGAKTKNEKGHLLVTSVLSDTPAAQAGLSANDEVIAVDHHRVSSSNIQKIVRLLGAGTHVELLVARQGLLKTLPVVLGEEPRSTWRLQVHEDASDAQTIRLETWLSGATSSE